MSAGTRIAAAEALLQSRARSPLGQLLHALNQPLTGLQCSMEVALAAPRTVEQYRQGLRDGLELTSRMRSLVEAIREVVDGQERTPGGLEVFELASLLRDTLRDLGPVAEQKRIRITVNAQGSATVRAERRRWAVLLFQSLEAVISLAAAASEVTITLQEDFAAECMGMSLRIHWCRDRPGSPFSRAELALLVAEAGWEAAGAKWWRERKDDGEMVNVRLAPTIGSSGKSPAANG